MNNSDSIKSGQTRNNFKTAQFLGVNEKVINYGYVFILKVVGGIVMTFYNKTIYKYAKNMHDNLSMYAAYPIESRLSLGDYGPLQDFVFQGKGNI
jgi:hypothetical protein